MSIVHQDSGQKAPPKRAWHALPADDAARALDTGPRGLTADEARTRLAEHGPNRLEEAPPTHPVVVFLRQFRSPLIYILLVATFVALALGQLIDATVIGAVLLLNAVIGFGQERKAEASVRALMQLVSPKARVVREGHEWEIDSADLVPGDLVLLESGVRVPADIRLASVTGLLVDESLLTGESLPVTKQSRPVEAGVAVADRRGVAHTGSVVTSGRGRGYVVATGAATELGAIAEHIRGAQVRPTPLQERMRRFGHVIGFIVLVSALAAFALGVALGEPSSEMFLVAVALAVAAIPEGLPVVFTIALALGVRRMAQRNAIIRRLPAVETLGSTTVIGSDKTGTLTQNRMTVQEVWTAGGTVDLTTLPADIRLAPDREVPAPGDGAVSLALLAGVLANEAELYRDGDGVHTTGDPTEVALLVAAARAGIEPEQARAAYHPVAEIPFEPERRWSGSIRSWQGEHVAFVKGAPERLLEMCAAAATVEGVDPLDRGAGHQAARAMAGRGLRVLAMAYRRLPRPLEGGDDIRDVEEVLASGELIFLGMQGMLDPPRAGVREAIDGCRSAGMRVVMITGDHALTARAIARDLGLAGDGAAILTGEQIEEMDDDQLEAAIVDVVVFARVAPEHKLRIVQALQARGEVVAVTGDGVNDAPALKRADIGVAMGRDGTDVAREAADMVLADDNFVSIYAAVEEGRVTFDNVRKVSVFLISTGAAAILTIISALVLGWPIPFVAAQLLWLNLVTNGLQDVALAFEPGEPGVLDRPPRARSESIISALMWERTVLTGVVMAAGTLLLFDWALREYGSLVQARSIALTTMVIFMAFHVGNCRSGHRSVLAVSPISNRFLIVAQATALSVHIGALYLAPTQFVLRVEPIALNAWPRIVAIAFTIVVAVELHKLIGRPRASIAR